MREADGQRGAEREREHASALQRPGALGPPIPATDHRLHLTGERRRQACDEWQQVGRLLAGPAESRLGGRHVIGRQAAGCKTSTQPLTDKTA